MERKIITMILTGKHCFSISAEELLKAGSEHLQPASVLHLLREAAHVHDRLVGFVEQLGAERRLHSLSPGDQLGSPFKHIQTSSNGLQTKHSKHDLNTGFLEKTTLQLSENDLHDLY